MSVYEGLYISICKELGCEFGGAFGKIKDLKDKLHKCNMQIKELEKERRSNILKCEACGSKDIIIKCNKCLYST